MTKARRTTPSQRPVAPMEAAWIRGMTQRRFSRRDFLRYSGTGAAGLGAAWVLAACGSSGQALPTVVPSLSPKAGQVKVANWPLYIDSTKATPDSVLGEFQDGTSIQISYAEDINDNDEFFGTDLRQQLSDGEPTGWDVIVMTDWMIAKLIRLGWLTELHQDLVPNASANLADQWKQVYFDPGRKYSYPWAAGITGIGYNPTLTGRPITKIEDLFDPAFAGQVGMFSEMRDSVNFALLAAGVVPTEATEAEVDTAFAKLEKQNQDGIVRGYYGNDYTDQLAGGNLALCMAWSGDVNALKVDTPELEFVLPEEGGNRWSDNMCIPALAEHPTDAHEWINFVYDPAIAAQITEFVWYESPVKGVQEIIQTDAESDPELEPIANSETVWPTPEIEAQLYDYPNLDEAKEQDWHDRWDPIVQG
jgi:spermidine/putrescine transport system substrate-binding protein